MLRAATAWRTYVTFVTPDAATTSIVGGLEAVAHRGAICQHFLPPCPTGRTLGDFIDAALAPDGRVVVAYDAGCKMGAPCASAADSHGSFSVVALEESGPKLR